MSTYVVTDAADATPLEVRRAADYPAWLAEQPDPIAEWLSDSGFAPEAGQWTWLPGAAGPERVLALVEEFSPTCIGHLPLALPERAYRLAAGDPVRCALSWGLGAYQFTRYKDAVRAPATLVCGEAEGIDRVLAAVYLVRDLINTPTNDMLPDALEAAVQGLADEFGAECRTVVGDALLTENFPTIHAVGRASACAPRLVELTWGAPDQPALTLVGKGVCFDSGGLDVKSATGMRLMKKDMGGAAHAIGLARLVMAAALPVRLRLLIPAVENAISANAYRPGDVITTRKGISVEIDNTDAEGRLILCDALALAAEAEPALVIDFATLTGAARSALGPDVPAMFANVDAVADGIVRGAESVADPVWRMPLHQPYKSMLESKVADLANAAGSPMGGAITAALFLERFIDAVPWVHFDLMAWNTTDRPGRPQGGEAMGLRAVYAYLSERFGA